MSSDDFRMYGQFERFHNDYGMSMYEALGAKPGDNDEEIRKAFRKKALELHPDRNPDKGQEAEERFKGINEAYSVLSNSGTRTRYNDWFRMFGATVQNTAAAKGAAYQQRAGAAYQYSTAAQRPRPPSASPADLEARVAAVLSNKETLWQAAAGLNDDDYLTLFDRVHEEEGKNSAQVSERGRAGAKAIMGDLFTRLDNWRDFLPKG